MRTGDNNRFLRLWYEISYEKLCTNANSEEEAEESSKKWFPYNKGGLFRKWYGNLDYVVNWEKNGKEIKDNTRRVYPQLGDDLGWKITSEDKYFTPGLAWSRISSSNFGVRICDKLIFDTAAPMFFADNPSKNLYYAGLMCSSVAHYILNVLNPTLTFQVGDVAKLPVIYDDILAEDIVKAVEICYEISRHNWDSYEVSWNFKKHPLVGEYQNIEEAFQSWKEKCAYEKAIVARKETFINNAFATIYGLNGYVKTEVSEDEVTLFDADEATDIKSFVSYAVGCMFGRYSLDIDGIAYAGGDWDRTKYKTFETDQDAIIPITDEYYFDDDIVTRLVDLIRIIYGEDSLEKNLDFIAKHLGNKGKTSREVIRNYFLNDFYKDHCNMYSVTGSGKRPIYWMFDSGKQNGFKALIYIHRYNPDTVGLIRSTYLHKVQAAIENSLQNAEYVISTSSSATEKAAASKKRDKYVKQLNELRPYYQALSHVALQRIDMDLDDGVKANYQLFQGVEISTEGKKKQKIDLLAKI